MNQQDDGGHTMTGYARWGVVFLAAAVMSSGCAINPERLNGLRAAIYGYGLQPGERVEEASAESIHTEMDDGRLATHQDPYQGSVGRVTVRNRADHPVYLLGAFVPGLGLAYLEKTLDRGSRVIDAVPLQPGEQVVLDGHNLRLRFDWPASYAAADQGLVAGYTVVRIGECMMEPGCVVKEPATFRLAASGSLELASR